MTNQQTLLKDVHLWQHGKTYVFMLSGKAGVGKTFSANILKELLSKEFNFIDIKNFARSVKYIATTSFGWNGKKDKAGRKLLQDIGRTGREYNKDIWAEIIVDEVSMGFPLDALIIDDWRYPNEYQVLADNDTMDVTTIRINAPNREILTGTQAQDVSEVSLDDFKFDYVIDNSGDDKTLMENLEKIVNQTLTKS